MTDPHWNTTGHRYRCEPRPKPSSKSDDGEFIAHRPKIIYLAGRDPHGEALGLRDFRMKRREGESEAEFETRAIKAAAAAHLPWVAFHRDPGQAYRRDDALEEALV